MELNNITNTGTWGQQVTRLNDNFNKVALGIDTLQEMYESLSQSAIEVVDTLPQTGKANKIYRLVGTTSYSDYMYNADDLTTPILMATFNNAVESRPKKASLNLVTSGGVFDNMGALDVSELNATENPHTIAKYVDLSSALAAVPTDYQKGGMSIKFVQTSDNKYIQVRCMAQNFTTDVTQWQGVDNEPTAESENLVKSGGIFSKTHSVSIKGKGNDFVRANFDWLVPGHVYIVAFKKVWDASSVTDTGSRFAIYSLYSGGENNLVYVTDLSTLKSYYRITVPSNSETIRIGGRGNVGSEMQFSIIDVTDFDNFGLATGYGYFYGATFPVFKLNDSNSSVLDITLPSAVLGIYTNSNKKILEFDCSTLTNRTYSISSTQCLVLDITNNIISVVPFNTSLSNCIILLGSSGGSNKGGIFGLLSPYYYRFLDDTNMEDLEFSTNIVDAISSHVENINVLNNTITINPGFNVVLKGVKYGVDVNTTLETLDNPSGTRVVYTYCYLSKKAVKNNDSANLFLVTSSINSEKDYILFAVWYYSTLTSAGIIGRLNNPKLNKFETKIKYEISIAYFTNAFYPQFILDYKTDSQVKVILPAEKLRLYDQSGGVIYEFNCAQLTSREFIVGSTAKLVYDIGLDTIKVVAANTNSENYVTLLAIMGSYRNRGAVTGLLQGYYIANILCSQDNLVKDINNVNRWSDLRLLFFSDVHAASDNVKRIVDMANNMKSNNQVDCIINGGDTVASVVSEGLGWYNTIVDNSAVPVLTVPGNHDCWEHAATWEWSDKIDVYNLVISKVAQQANITQPSDAAQNGYTYYYKDFGNIRIICLNAMEYAGNELYFDNTQKTWLQNVLESARTTYHYVKAQNSVYVSYELSSGDTVTGTYPNIAQLNDIEYIEGAIYAIPMSVIIVNHSPFGSPQRIESNKLNSYAHYEEQNFRTKGMVFDGIKLAGSAISIVANYIQNGGSFICWLTGHTHLDNVMVETEHTNQFMININSANNTKKNDGVANTVSGWYDYDSYDYIGIDVRSGLIKVLRIGWHKDSSMRNRESWCYDYVHHKLMSEN